MRLSPAFRSLLILTSGLVPTAALAQETTDSSSDTEEIIVTGTRRESSVQDVPINIAAVGAQTIEEQRSFNLREVSRLVPGVYVVDNGARTSAPIIFRGLNADPLSSYDNDLDGGGTVATYVGEIPLFVDFRLHDVERVEFLLGPQGTLYGAGTLGGAIRYIPKRPEFDANSADVRGDVYSTRHSSGLSSDVGVTLNIPLGSAVAFRGSVDYLNDQGFIDYAYAVRTPGVSDPDPDFANAADMDANLRRLEDLNYEKTVTARAALRVAPAEIMDVNFAYTRQVQRTGGRQLSGYRVDSFPVEVGEYESVLRVPEPNRRETELFSIEGVLDLDFAELTSATGWSREEQDGNRDQTDLLIGLEYGYELFPSFTALTTEVDRRSTFTQEVRLVSSGEGPFSWIVGGFYNNQRYNGSSSEFTPGFDQFAFDEFGGVGLRPDGLEYYSVSSSRLKEKAGFGELGYDITSRWNVTVGGRYYDYDLETLSAVDLPLYYSVFEGRDPDSIELEFEEGGQKDDGFLFKVNTSFELTPDALVYGTVSQGYRIGNSNGVAACPTPLPPTQIVCALPNEFFFGPDKTLNFELGAKTQWFDRRLTLNGALYYIDWSDPQVSSATQNGLSPITINGAGAESKGFELAAAWREGGLTLRANYAFTDPKLTETTPNLIQFITPPGFQSTIDYVDGEPGDRLPGSPRHQGNLFVAYDVPLSNGLELGLSYTGSAQSNVIQVTGGRGNNTTLPGFSIHGVAARLQGDGWMVQLYVDNLFDKFAEVGVRGSAARNQVVEDIDGEPVYARTFGTYVLPPRSVGLRFTSGF